MPKPNSAGLPPGISLHHGRYRVRIFYNGVQHSLGVFETLGDAKAAATIARGEMTRGIFIPPSERRAAIRDAELLARVESVTVAEWAEDWLGRLASLDKSPGTLRTYASTLNVHVLPFIGDHRLVDVTPEDVDNLLERVRARRGSWANVARTVRALFRAAIAARVGGLTESPVQVVVPKDARSTRAIDGEHVATPAEVRAMAEAMPEHLRIAIPLAAWCALRLGEVLGLQRRDLEHLDDPEQATLHVRRQWNTKARPPGYTDPKAGSARAVAIPQLLLADLAEHVEQHAGPGREGPLLPSPRNPAVPVSQTALDLAWRAARDQVRPGFRFHALRHTGLTAYARSGATLEELKRRGGHQSIETAARYQHATVERDRALTARLNLTIGES